MYCADSTLESKCIISSVLASELNQTDPHVTSHSIKLQDYVVKSCLKLGLYLMLVVKLGVNLIKLCFSLH